MTIKQMRTKDAIRLAERISPDPTIEEIEAAKHTMRLFYRFAAAYYSAETLHNMRSATEAAKAAADEKSEKAYQKAVKALKKYNLYISIPGLYPIIEEKNGASFTFGHWYS